MSVIVRFAPSPTGFIHIGNARAALINWLFARKNNGKFMLRIDDTDQVRSRQECVDALYEDLSWLKLDYDMFAKQSDRLDEYKKAMNYLIKIGRLYPCYETQEELDRKRKIQAKRNEPPVYDRSALKLSKEEIDKFEIEGRKPHWRFKLNDNPVIWDDLIKGEIKITTTGSLSDPVLVKEDGTFLYTISSVVDDIEFNVTHIIRGEDHLTNTAIQIQLFEALAGNNCSVKFAHLPLLLDKDGAPLSKRIDSFCLRNLRENGIDGMTVNCFILGLGTSKKHIITNDINDLISYFDFDCIRGGSRIDMEAIENIQKKLIHVKSYVEVKDKLESMDISISEEQWDLIRGSIEEISEVKKWLEILNNNSLRFIENVDLNDKEYLKEALDLLKKSEFDENTWSDWSKSIKEKTGRSGRSMIHPIRLALTGMDNGPEISKLIIALGYEIIKNRLSN